MKGFDFLVDSKIACISEAFSKRNNLSLEEAMRQFLASGTLRALNNAETDYIWKCLNVFMICF